MFVKDLAVPPRSFGMVKEVDDTRSAAGFNVLVDWDKKPPEATWVPEQFLEVL